MRDGEGSTSAGPAYFGAVELAHLTSRLEQILVGEHITIDRFEIGLCCHTKPFNIKAARHPPVRFSAR